MGGVSSATTNTPDSYKSNLSPRAPNPGNSLSPNSSTISSNSTILSSDVNTSESKTCLTGSKTHEDQTPEEVINSRSSTKTKEDLDQSKKPTDEKRNDGEVEDEEEGECGFCLYMKAGGCKDAFIVWENCVQEAENSNEDVVDKCKEVTGALTRCMQAHADYYEPILRAEKAAKEEVLKEMEKGKGDERINSNVAETEMEIVVDSRE